MKNSLLLFFACLICTQINAQDKKPVYDSVLAKKVGADDYGMKSYVFAILKKGSYAAKDKKESDSLFRGHMANIGRLADEGKLVVAGPLGKNDKDYSGIFIFNVKTTEEAKKLCETDPAIKSGIFIVEFYPWYCSGALMEINKIHKAIQKKSF